MPNKSPLRDACTEVIGKMDGIMTTGEIVKAVLEIFPSKAKKPSSSIQNELRYRQDVVSLEDDLWARTDFLADGAKFRIRLAGDDLILGVTKTHWFKPFDYLIPPIESRFVDESGNEIPVVSKQLELLKLDDEQLLARLETMSDSIPLDKLSEHTPWDVDDPVKMEIDETMDDKAILAKALKLFREKLKTTPIKDSTFHDMSDFFLRHQAEEGDFLIVTVKPGEKSYIFDFEPANMANTSLIEQRDAEFRDLIRRAVKDKTRVPADKIILAAYHKFPWMKVSPCSHWIEIIENDDSLRFIKVLGTFWEIAPIDHRIPMDMVVLDMSTTRKLEKRVKTIEGELEELHARIERALDETADQLKIDEIGGVNNVIAGKRRKFKTEEAIDKHNMDLIYGFFVHEIERGKSETASGDKANEIKLFADVLLSQEEIPIDRASFDDLGRFAFELFPATFILTANFDIRKVLGSIRDFYRYLVSTGRIRSAGFAEALYKTRDLAAELASTYRRLPPEFFDEEDDFEEDDFDDDE